jgi:hypothetical protein
MISRLRWCDGGVQPAANPSPCFVDHGGTWKIGSVAVIDRNSFAMPVRVNGPGATTLPTLTPMLYGYADAVDRFPST